MTRGDIVMTILGTLIVVGKATAKQVRGRDIPTYLLERRQTTLETLAQEQLDRAEHHHSYSVFKSDALLPYTPEGLHAIQDHQARVNQTSQQFVDELKAVTDPIYQRRGVAMNALREEEAALFAKLREEA